MTWKLHSISAGRHISFTIESDDGYRIIARKEDIFRWRIRLLNSAGSKVRSAYEDTTLTRKGTYSLVKFLMANYKKAEALSNEHAEKEKSRMIDQIESRLGIDG